MQTQVLIDRLLFGEGPRWRNDRLWFSDLNAGVVMSVDLQGHSEVVARVPGSPSGLGWLPDGRLQIVSMTDRRLLRLDPDGLTVVADLFDLASYHCNDMVMDELGRTYIGNFGFDLALSEPPRPAELVLVTPEGRAKVVADDLVFPNGAVITPDGKTLVVAETFAERLTSFDIESDGSLSNRKVFAVLEGATPDGICLDAEGAIWVASPRSKELIRVHEGGQIAKRETLEARPYACMLGGPQRKTLFIMTVDESEDALFRRGRLGRIEMASVEVPGAGLP
jgi:sugar lactone lactonase YvrE